MVHEVVSGEIPRPHYAALMQRLTELGPEDLEARSALLESIFRDLGVTFAVYGREEGAERTWPMDLATYNDFLQSVRRFMENQGLVVVTEPVPEFEPPRRQIPTWVVAVIALVLGAAIATGVLMLF